VLNLNDAVVINRDNLEQAAAYAAIPTTDFRSLYPILSAFAC
jgi:hypothetical protein